MRRHARTRLEPVKQHADLRLADGRNHGLARVLIALDLERGIGVRGLLEKRVELSLGPAGVRLDRDAVERVGEAERCRLDLAGDRERVARLRLELGHHDDVARGGSLDVLGLLAAHEVEVAEALGLAGARVRELHARRERAGEDLEEREPPVLGVVQRLEREGDGAVVVRRDVELLAVDQRDPPEVGHRGEPAHHGVHEADDAFLLDAGAAEHGDEQAVDHGLGEKTLELFLRDLLALEVLHHDLVVRLGHEVGELGACLLGGAAELVGYVRHDRLAVLEVARLHVHDVDDAREGLARAHRDGDRAELGAKALLEGGHRQVVVGVGAVDAVDEEGTGEREVLGRVPQAGRDGPRAARRVDHEQRGLAGAHGCIGVADEIGVARGVEHVDAGALPLDGRDGRADREAALGLLAIVVQRGLGAGVASQAGGAARQVKHGLGQHGLAHAALAHKDHVLDLLSTLCSHDASFVGASLCTMLQTIPTSRRERRTHSGNAPPWPANVTAIWGRIPN